MTQPVHIAKHRREKPGRELRPGSATALRRGCRCSATINGLTQEMILMSKNCPLHKGLTEWPVKTTLGSAEETNA